MPEYICTNIVCTHTPSRMPMLAIQREKIHPHVNRYYSFSNPPENNNGNGRWQFWHQMVIALVQHHSKEEKKSKESHLLVSILIFLSFHFWSPSAFKLVRDSIFSFVLSILQKKIMCSFHRQFSCSCISMRIVQSLCKQHGRWISITIGHFSLLLFMFNYVHWNH